ncbi:MAG: hypothetical protein KZQ76_06820 [Candidatus Thiodiazotropha sp. (ex Epidulcina cf. delphinae)]|nr:hypothetical protein [Candidatus Thiodiazotropha sp. (ex Epidulcina cf. delphinae)]
MFASDRQVTDLFDAMVDQRPRESKPIAKERVHKSDPDKVVIGDIKLLTGDVCMKPVAGTDCKRLYFCNALPNFECGVCFDHPLDHYPLMMIFEMGRQVGIAVSHEFYGVPLKGHINIVDALSFEFKRFLELDKPVYIVCADSAVQERKGLLRREMNLAFIQEGVHCASGSGNVSIVSHALYKRMRAASRSGIIGRPVAGAHAIPTNVDLIDPPDRVAACERL